MKLPFDYVRLDEPVPRSAVVSWWLDDLIFAISAVVFTYVFLTGGHLG